jgi:hypothetical protein
MSFIQFKLDKSINQARGIYDKYVYETTDTALDILVSGYFDDSRFVIEGDWNGSVIECKCSNGYVIGLINQGGQLTVLYDSTIPRPPSTTIISDDYQILLTDDYIITDGGNTITFPLFAQADRPFFVINEGVTNDTLDGNGETVPTSTLLTPTEVRGFIPGTSAWLEI